MYALTHICRMSNEVSILQKNLDWLIKRKKTSPYELQRVTGVPQPTIHRIQTGESSDPRTKTLQPLADYFGVSVADLRERDLSAVIAEGEMVEVEAKQYHPAHVLDDDDPKLIQVPKVRLRVAAGISGFHTDPERFDGSTMTVSKSWVQRHGYDPLKLIWIRVGGRSMEKTLFEDDWVLINTAQTQPKDSKIFAVNFEGEAVIKRLTRDAGQWWLTSDNQDPQYYRRQCRDGECIIVGEAVLKYSEAL
jgi:phage repressor protein C with HTH and peptisase S24 domain